MTTALDALPARVAGRGRRKGLLRQQLAGLGADIPDRVDPATLVAICRLVLAAAWLASDKLSSLIGDRR